MKKNMLKNKKVIILGIIIVVIILLGMIYVLLGNQIRSRYDCREFQHSFSPTYECRAIDAGKKCLYDDECSLGNCVYATSFFDGRQPELSAEELLKGGRCDDYLGDNDGVTQCHRQRDKKVQCDFSVS